MAFVSTSVKLLAVLMSYMEYTHHEFALITEKELKYLEIQKREKIDAL